MSALSLSPLVESGNVAIDEDTGDIYIWNDEVDNYELVDSRADSSSGDYNVILVDNSSDDSVDSVGVQGASSPVTLSDESIEQLAETLADYNAEDGYNLGTTYQTIFAGVAYKVPFGQHYVYWRDSQYSYKFAYGDIELNGSEFVGNDVITVCSYDTSNGYNSVYSWTTRNESNFSLSANDALVYSDLGSYPDIFNRRGLQNETGLFYAVVCFCIWKLFSNLRKSAFGR